MKIFLIRHGETTGDVEDRYGGMYDDHLTQKGREQLQATAQKLAGKHVDRMYVSTLVRAQESAQIINEQLQTRIELVQGLCERDYGVLGGMTKKEALEKYPEAVEARKDPLHTDPEGESYEDYTNRVLSTFESIVAQKHHSVAILSHGGTIKMILQHLKQPVPDSIGDGEVIEIDI